MGKASILIVEDEPLIAMDIERRLQRLGYDVVAIADSAETALQALAQFQPNLVLMDIQLHGDIDGIEIATQIRQQFQLPVVYLTAHADAATLEQAKATQPFGYIVKPFGSNDLSTAIEIALCRHQAELAIKQALEREKELNELKSRFVAIVSHEFRNPLTSIQFSLDLLKDSQQLTPEKKQTYIQRAQACVQQMQALLEDVLVIGAAEARKLPCQPTLIDMHPFCRGLVDTLQTDLQTRHTIVFSENFLQTTNTVYSLDEKLLQRILTNLLSNAVKYSPDESQVLFDVTYAPETVTLQIQDQGIGIPIADQVDLFSPFHRGRNASKMPGTGLGLSIVKQAVEAHGGSITVESKVGVGTTFTIVLPQLF